MTDLEPRYSGGRWTTLDEKRSLDHMINNDRVDPRTTPLTLRQKVDRLEGWINTVKDRHHLKSVDYPACEKHARGLLKGLTSD